MSSLTSASPFNPNGLFPFRQSCCFHSFCLGSELFFVSLPRRRNLAVAAMIGVLVRRFAASCCAWGFVPNLIFTVVVVWFLAFVGGVVASYKLRCRCVIGCVLLLAGCVLFVDDRCFRRFDWMDGDLSILDVVCFKNTKGSVWLLA
ncbi:hypothetical protein MtrunA17_Chr2g0320021 [Medicago truncatula]|uniref:Transmembrane protein n=1 Tax=Medicago truncatula TaxID=3880 RepID=A0A396JDE6_MEDTR|nr:hypothetical protein MtrunA17_Chr2g0320021 [Medicago truncatula]